MHCFQSMAANLQDSVGSSQQHSVTDFCDSALMESIGDRVRREREAQGISRADLAKMVGAKGESYISELELGRIKKGSRLHLIAQALKVDLTWLETGRGVGRLDSPYPVSAAKPMRHAVGESYGPDAWPEYQRASAATRTAVDLLLLPADERERVTRAYPHLVTGISLLEQWAQEALAARKTA